MGLECSARGSLQEGETAHHRVTCTNFHDMGKPTIVSADASSYGLGGVLLQKHDGQLKPVSFCSRTLTDAEQCYVPIEKECLAAVWAYEKFSRYLYGLDSFTLQSDHKPLSRRLLLRMMYYNPTAEYAPGKEFVIADTLSRHPRAAVTHEITELSSEIKKSYEEAARKAWPISPSKLDLVRQQTPQDAELQMVQHYMMTGWPKYAVKVPDKVKAYYTSRHCLTMSKGLVLYNNRIAVLQKTRPDILQRIHDGHQGIVKCREQSRCSVWWIRISRDIQEMVSICKHCQESKPTLTSNHYSVTQSPMEKSSS